MIILGIDPGTDRMGYGVIDKENSSLKFIAAGILRTKKLRGGAVLLQIKKELAALIKKYQPELLATEKLFFMKNQTTAMQIAEARGVILLTAAENNMPLLELAPTEVKMAVTGYGQADKKSVLKMVKLILKAPDLKIIDDASDALAIAIAAAGRRYPL